MYPKSLATMIEELKDMDLNELEVNYIESTDEWVVNCGNHIAQDNLTECEAYALYDELCGKFGV